MDIKWKNYKDYSHSIITKIIVAMIAILCFTGVMNSIINVEEKNNGYLGIAFEKEYLLSEKHWQENVSVLGTLSSLVREYKNEEVIMTGEVLRQDEFQHEEQGLYWEFQSNSKHYNPQLSHDENYKNFQEVYAERIQELKDRLINNDLKQYKFLLKTLESYEGVVYYATDGENVFTNISETDKKYFKSFPAYSIFDEDEQEIYPKKEQQSWHYWPYGFNGEEDTDGDKIYIAFVEDYLNVKAQEWTVEKDLVTKELYKMIGFLAGLLISLIYLILTIGRESFADQELHFNPVDRIYNDVKVVFFFLLILWVDALIFDINNYPQVMIGLIVVFGILGLVLFLSFVKHLKNRTLLKHTLVYTVFYKFFKFVNDIYNSGSVGVKIVIAIMGYPAIVALTFFMFPVTIGVAVWLAFKRVKQYNAIKEGVKRIKDGEIYHTIEVSGKGEFAKLAEDINSITDGLKKAVDNELKSERLKTELITNVSHDIRTPLTSIITYVDLLKKEDVEEKAKGYIEILDQKSQRLKVLTDDLFEAAKASSGSIPVDLQRIDIVSLVTQGLGELNDKVEALDLQFKINHPKEKIYVTADGKLLWRAIENLLSNIFKYALRGSRVYVDIEDVNGEVKLTVKNISAYELNISSEELMERFKRGDESRTSQGSGLGLSIAKSLIDIQRGKFNIEIDGDLFKAMICLPRYQGGNE